VHSLQTLDISETNSANLRDFALCIVRLQHIKRRAVDPPGPPCYSNRFDVERVSEQQSPANLDHAHAASCALSGDDAERTAAVERAAWITQVHKIEDVCRLATELKFHALANGEIAEQRRVDVLISRSIQELTLTVLDHIRFAHVLRPRSRVGVSRCGS
jgi:hypothetical protein